MPGISSTFESREPPLADLLREIDGGSVQLPDFQRPWVWDDVHIRSLLASVSLAYPIGAVMLLQTGGEGVRFKPRPVHGVQLERATEPDRLILDGQQRLTSLYGALWSGRPVATRDEKQKPLRRYYYIDLAVALDPEADRFDAIRSVPADLVVMTNFGRDVELDLRESAAEYEHGLVPAWKVLRGTEFSDWRNGYMRHFDFDRDRIAVITAFEEEVYRRFQHFKVPVIQLLRDTPKEAVCQVFEKVNTGGVALTVFELLTATFAADDFRLREDWEARRERLYQHDVLRAVGGKEFLQAVTLLSGYQRFLATRDSDRPSAVSVKRKDVLKLSLDDYQRNADALEAGFIRAARLLARLCIFDRRNLPYGTQLIPLGATCAHLGSRFEEQSARDRLAQWYWAGVFGEMYGGANETRYALDIQDLSAWILEGGPEPRTIRDASFRPNRLLTLRSRQSAAYKGAMALMVQRGSRDFVNGDPIAHTQGFELSVDIHHIFPKSWARKQLAPSERSWDSIVNKAPLTSHTNRLLGGHAPSRYLERVEGQGAITGGELDEVLTTHFIHPPLLRSDDYWGFLADRARRLLDAVGEAMGKPVQGRDAEGVVEAFGVSLTWPEEEEAPPPNIVLFDRYEVTREIGGGGMSQVYQARDRETGELVCVKRVVADGRQRDALLRELQIYDRVLRQGFSHALDVLDVPRRGNELAIVIPWADGGTLEAYVQEQGGRLMAGECKSIAGEVLRAIAELHALEVVHRDIKPANVLRVDTAWKLADFGLAKNTQHPMTRVTMQQSHTRGYAPPEQVEGAEAAPSQDVYAFGKLVTFLLTGGTDPDMVPGPGWRELARACTARDPALRPSMEAVASSLDQLPGTV